MKSGHPKGKTKTLNLSKVNAKENTCAYLRSGKKVQVISQ
jgi:hypothetical protein